MFSNAQDLAEEERDLAAKYQRDGRRTEADAERDSLRKAMEEVNATRAAQEFKDRASELDVHALDDDELSANVGILSAKKCPQCGDSMQIVQGAFNTTSNKRNFYWRCTAIKRNPCPTVKLDPGNERASVVRPESADFDTPKDIRRSTWEKQHVVNETHSRQRQHLGDEDQQLVCPKHLLPLKLVESRKKGGKLLDSYEYVCLAINADGSACDHNVTLQTMPQVAAMLQRTEGEGIIRN